MKKKLGNTFKKNTGTLKNKIKNTTYYFNFIFHIFYDSKKSLLFFSQLPIKLS